ncbi:hypothetical protein H5P28_14620 [Ruficoccus amylovorans]|uniref:Uncharacterized protein n=1 Tax=Ruficoccus amylovorans TaxID=1804625 RepID=A0A842HJ14_9BACT|nr:hypothetical protein [Ruficoccus amylovorans]MBC2595497.1 hypothetical protein [Ruficoccus amylovorans]
MSDETVKPQDHSAGPGVYEREDYDDYPKPSKKDKMVLIGMLAGLALLFLFIIVAVGF